MHGPSNHILLLLTVLLPSSMALALGPLMRLILHILIKLEILKPIILQYVMRDGLILINLIHELLQIMLIVLFLLQIEDDRTAYKRSQNG